MTEIRKAGALIFKDKRMLIVRSKGKEYFVTPGGKYEKNENAEECLRRELQEELRVGVASFKHYKDSNFKKAAHSDQPLLLNLYIVEISGEPMPSSEIEEMEWMSQEDFHNKKFHVAPSFYVDVPDLIKAGLI